MNRLDHLKTLIHPQAHIEVINNHEDGVIRLEEKEGKAKLKQVELRGFDVRQTFAFKLDIPNKRLSEYLNPSEPKINKGCDGIVFTVIHHQEYVFICELKSGKPSKEEYLLQFRNSRVFIEYIDALLREFYEVNSQNLVKYILFDNKQKNRLNKTIPRGRKKIEPEIVGQKQIPVYKIHHLDKSDFLNINHLNLI